LGLTPVMEPDTVEAGVGHFGKLAQDAVGQDFGEMKIAHLATGNHVGLELFEFEGVERNDPDPTSAGLSHFCVQDPNVQATADRIEEHGGLQWPCPSEDHPGTCVLHSSGEFTCGMGRFSPADWTPPAEVPDDEYPLVLSTGRRLYHYHTRTQTGRCEGLNDLLGEETADISAADADRLGIEHGEVITVKSRRGAVMVRANVTPEVPEGMVWMAFHFTEANANWLTNPAFDPDTLTAEYKACAVAIEKIEQAAAG